MASSHKNTDSTQSRLDKLGESIDSPRAGRSPSAAMNTARPLSPTGGEGSQEPPASEDWSFRIAIRDENSPTSIAFRPARGRKRKRSGSSDNESAFQVQEADNLTAAQPPLASVAEGGGSARIASEGIGVTKEGPAALSAARSGPIIEVDEATRTEIDAIFTNRDRDGNVFLYAMGKTITTKTFKTRIDSRTKSGSIIEVDETTTVKINSISVKSGNGGNVPSHVVVVGRTTTAKTFTAQTDSHTESDPMAGVNEATRTEIDPISINRDQHGNTSFRVTGRVIATKALRQYRKNGTSPLAYVHLARPSSRDGKQALEGFHSPSFAASGFIPSPRPPSTYYPMKDPAPSLAT